jgi:diacylglycerol O-acyltransferase
VSTRPLNPLDASWLLVESRDTPMHVGGMIQFTLPPDAPADSLRALLADFRACRDFAPPWNQRLRRPGLKGLMPSWEETDEIDLEHHVRLSALPKPGGERELGQLIARLHSQPLDLKRPPWECELIEGLEGDRFAIYIKMHHSLIDGISGMKMLVRSMAGSAEASRKLPPFWSMGIPAHARRKHDAAPTLAQVIEGAIGAVRGQLGTLPDVARAFGSMFGLGREPGEGLELPFGTPMSVINGRIHGPRRFATQLFAIERLRKVAEASGATLNDVVLAICGGALRRFLAELDQLPDKSLTAGIPVSVRPSDDEGAGNAITFIIATLGTDIDDPRERLAAITASTRRAKAHVSALPKQAMMQYTVMLMAPYIVSLLTGVGGRTRPMFNVTISNVPGPDKPLYFRGARMDAAYPVSLVTHGQALNITCQSYDGNLAFGFTGCRDSLPHMQRIATYTGEALAELEQALAAPAAKSARRRAATRANAAPAKGAKAAKAAKASKGATAPKVSQPAVPRAPARSRKPATPAPDASAGRARKPRRAAR